MRRKQPRSKPKSTPSFSEGELTETVKLNVESADVITPDNAERKLSTAMYYLGFSTDNKFKSRDVDTKIFLEQFQAPKTYQDLKNNTRVYSFPKKFNWIYIKDPDYYKAWDLVPQFSWRLGIGRTPRDTKSGETNQYWEHNDGTYGRCNESAIIHELKQAGKDLNNYPTESRLNRKYTGFEPTCWASFHLMFPKDKKPFVGLSVLQNELLQIDPEVISEFKKLRKNSKSNWRGHYDRILKSYHENPNYNELPFAFAYPNRALLLPLAGIQIAQELGVNQFKLAGKGNEEHPIYKQAYEFLKAGNTKMRLSFVGGLA